MKCIYVPKVKSIIIFLIFIVLGVCANLPFFLMGNSFVEYDLDMLLLMHVALPVIYSVIFCMILSGFLSFLETVISKRESDLKLKVFNLLGVLEICVGIFTLLFAVYQGNGQIEENIKILSETIYFKSLITDEDTSKVFLYWGYVYLLTLIASSAILFFAVSRQYKIKKMIKAEYIENQFKAEVDRFLGFEYESCDFYQQVNIPYQSLQQTDGTRGEFEVYHMLRNFGLTGVKYIFNREIPKVDGLSTELDLIVIHSKGIFVVENKHYTTRIYGNALDHDLTIIDRGGNKKSIYNPIRQNEKHVAALKEFLKSKELYLDDKTTPIYSIVVFTAEEDDWTDNIISGISTAGTETKVCTSQNVYQVINQLISNAGSMVSINVAKINEVLYALPIRKKYS